MSLFNHFPRKLPPRGAPDAGEPREPRSAAARATIWILFALTFFSVLIESWSRHTAYRSQLAQSRIAAENVAMAADEHVEGAMNTVSWLLDGIVERVETDGLDGDDRKRLADYMKTRLGKKDSALQGLYVQGAQGQLLVSTDAQPARMVTSAGRAYFDYHRTHADREVRIGPPIVSRVTGAWIITLSRRWNDDDGNFGGIVLATIPVDYFERYYRKFSVGRHGAMLLAMTDGTVVVGGHSDKDRVGQSVAGSPLSRFMRRSGPRGTVMLKAEFDGLERLMSYRRVEGYPLVVTVALAKKEILADWWTITRQEFAAIVVMLGTLYALGGWLLAHIRGKQRLEVRLRLAQADLEAKNATLARLARSDGLTGLANRRHLDERLAAETARAAREGGMVALIMIDVDFFKRYNDAHGHAAGDDCLRAVAAAIGAIVHRPADLAARFGGEEFAILLPNTDADGALRVAEAARVAVGVLAMPHAGNGAGGGIGVVTISAGVAAIRPAAADAGRALVEAADGALYRAKEAGRDRVAAA